MIDRYDMKLKHIGLLGEVDPGVRETLIEMYLLRNLIAHGASRPTQDFEKLRPDLNYEAGTYLVVEWDDWQRYQNALIAFITMCLHRAEQHLDPEIVKMISEIMQSSHDGTTIER